MWRGHVGNVVFLEQIACLGVNEAFAILLDGRGSWHRGASSSETATRSAHALCLLPSPGRLSQAGFRGTTPPPTRELAARTLSRHQRWYGGGAISTASPDCGQFRRH